MTGHGSIRIGGAPADHRADIAVCSHVILATRIRRCVLLFHANGHDERLERLDILFPRSSVNEFERCLP